MDLRVYKNVFKRQRMVLPTWKRSQLLQSELYLQREVFCRHLKLLHLRGRRLRRRKLNNSALRYKPISSTADVFQQQNRDSALYGKNQFSIRYHKTGTDHTLTVSPAVIRGEPILSISALKVPLCRQRYLRGCPMYLPHTVQTKKKAEKETRVTSIPGSKNLAVALIICCMSISMLLSAMLSKRRSTINYYEKKLERTVSVINEKNLQETEKLPLKE